jgi:hypothetical protein
MKYTIDEIHNMKYHNQRALARDPNTSREVLDVLVNSRYAAIKAAAAQHPNISSGALEILAADKYGGLGGMR